MFNVFATERLELSLSFHERKIKMLEIEKLKIELNNAIKWIKDYVDGSGAKGVVVRE